MTVTLESANGSEIYSETTFYGLGPYWNEYSAYLYSNGTDDAARLVVRSSADGPLLLDVVSLFPSENGPKGSISPFRSDVVELMAGMHPK